MNQNITICKRCGKAFNHGQRRRIYCSQNCYLQVVKEPLKPIVNFDWGLKLVITGLSLLTAILIAILVYEYYKKPVTIEAQLNEKFEACIDNYFRDRD